MDMRSWQADIIKASVVLAVGIALASLIGSLTMYRVRSLDNTLSVTGSAKQEVDADAAKWTVSVSRSAYEGSVPEVQTQVSRDVQVVVGFFTAGKIPAKNITTSPVSVDQEYSSDNNAPRRYTVRVQITVTSDDVHLIEKLSKDIGGLAQRGIIVSAGTPEYFVTTLPELRIALIGKAVEDAKARAEQIAKSTGQKVGALKSASGGVVQVLAPNSIEVSDYGSYDTQTIQKEVMVTARAVFLIR